MSTGQLPFMVDRYAVYEEFASGGTATVHFGRLVGPGGFGRTVAVKRLRESLGASPDFVRMLIHEARLVARINHQNVVQTLDVVVQDSETYLVMEYVHGVPLSLLVKRSAAERRRIDPCIVTSLMSNALLGLHAAHEATDERGAPLGIVHRDVSPQNILVGVDGSARVLDFGIAKAADLTHATREGYVKGKLAYMAPEQLAGRPVDRRTDIFAAGVVLWELLTGARLFGGGSSGDVVAKLVQGVREAPSEHAPQLGTAFDSVTLRCLALDPRKRIETARAAALALQECWPMAPAPEIGEWVVALAGDVLGERRRKLSRIEAERVTVAAPKPASVEVGADSGPSEPAEAAAGEANAARAAQPAAGTPEPQEPAEDEQDEQDEQSDGSDSSSVPAASVSVEEDEEEEDDDDDESDPPRRVPRIVVIAAALGVGIGVTYFGPRVTRAIPLPWTDGAGAASDDADAGTDGAIATPSTTPARVVPPSSTPVEPKAPARSETTAASPSDAAAAPAPAAPPPATASAHVAHVATAAPPAPVPAATPASRPAARPRTEVAVKPQARRDDCSQPYRVDDQGVKTYKAECL